MSTTMRVAGASALVGLLLIVGWARGRPQLPARALPDVSGPAYQKLPPGSDTEASAQTILARSAFDPDRQPFTRSMNAPPISRTVRLVGVQRQGETWRATVEIDNVQLTVGVGDQTPIGEVSAIGPSSALIGDRTINMFE